MKFILGIILEIIAVGVGSLTFKILGFIPGYIGMKFIVDGTSGNFIKNSSFMVMKKKKMKLKEGKVTVDMIGGNPIEIFKAIELFFKKDKEANFINETYNVFKQLPQKRKDKVIKYGCNSQVYTYKLLKKLKDNGYIDYFYYEEGKPSKLIFEQLMMGKIPKNKKRKMYKMVFTLTDKKITDEDFDKIMNPKKENKENEKNIQVTKTVNETKKELENIKENLLFLSQNYENSQNMEQEDVNYVKKR